MAPVPTGFTIDLRSIIINPLCVWYIVSCHHVNESMLNMWENIQGHILLKLSVSLPYLCHLSKEKIALESSSLGDLDIDSSDSTLRNYRLQAT